MCNKTKAQSIYFAVTDDAQLAHLSSRDAGNTKSLKGHKIPTSAFDQRLINHVEYGTFLNEVIYNQG